MSEEQPGAGRIRDRGYQPYRGAHTRESTRWAVIARRMARSAARSPGVIVMAVFAIFPALISAVAMYLELRVKSLLPGRVPDTDSYILTLLVQPYGNLLLAVLLAMFAGAGAIADDARAGAFQFYFARPLTRAQYLAGKLVPLAGLVALLTMVPATALALFRVALASSGGEALHALGVTVRAALLGALVALSLAAPALALSSLGKRRGLVQGAFAALIFLPWMVCAGLVQFTRSPWPALPSIPADLKAVGYALLGVKTDELHTLPAWAALAVLAAVIGGSLWVVWRRLGSVEVVA